MREPDRQARNQNRLQECHEVYAKKVAAVIQDMEHLGFRPRIQDAWRSPEKQREAFKSGNSKVKFGFHNTTGPQGNHEALAVDMLDDDDPLKPSSRYVLSLAAVARSHGLLTGILWDLPDAARQRTDAAVREQDFDARVQIGFDPCHIEVTGITLSEAENGKRPSADGLTAAEPDARVALSQRTLLVRRASGPLHVRAGDVAIYRAVEFNHADPTAAEKTQINWLIQSAGQTIEQRQAVGNTLEFDVPVALAGQTIRVMPFRVSPTPHIAVVTMVEGRVETGEEVGEPNIKRVSLEREDTRFFARINNGPRFFVGSDVRFRDTRGLMNTSDRTGTSYRPEDYRDQHGFWADFIYPTALCESQGFFQCINTYDRARFTFGFFQFAAHTPGDNFVLLLRDLLTLPLARAYFPDLTLHEGAIHRRTDQGLVRLESSDSTEALMNYLNPVRSGVDDVEAVNAAKFIHWSLQDQKHRDAQVDLTVSQMKKKMASYHSRYGLHGVVDTICLVIADIRHQGRAQSSTIISALQSDDPLGRLLRIGEDGFPHRIETLREAIHDGEREGILGTHRYDAVTTEFVPI